MAGQSTVLLLDTTSAAASPTSGVYDLVARKELSIQVKFTGNDVVGTLTLEGSLDGTSFFTLDNSTVNVTASTGHIYDVETRVRYIRVKFTYTSGTGNISVLLWLKDG